MLAKFYFGIRTNKLTKASIPVLYLLCFILACTDAPPKHFEWKTVVKGDWSAHLYDVHFVSEKIGWAVGNQAGMRPPSHLSPAHHTHTDAYEQASEARTTESIIIHTDDGGKNWNRQHSGIFGKPLRKIFFRNSSKGWCVGEDGVLIRTTDGGEKWDRLETETDNNLHDIFILGKTGWVVGDWGTLLQTTDGGQTFNLIEASIDGDKAHAFKKKSLQAIHFADNMHGWIVAYSTPRNGDRNSGYIYATADGGQTWQQQFSTEPALFNLHFLDRMTGWVVGDKRSLFFTNDGGNTWEFVTDGSNKRHKENYGQPDYLGNELLHTFTLYDIDFVDASHGWIVGDLGVILHKQKDKWKHQRGGPRFHNSADTLLLGVDFISKKLGWAVGENGTILQTRNGGITWESQSNPSHLLVDVCAVSPEEAYVVGDRGAILQTRNGGNAWNTQDSRTTECFGATHFVSTQKGWAVAESGVILHTTNGGSLWKRQFADTEQDLLALFFVDEHTGWCVGSGGDIIHTKDGGKNWQWQKSGTSATLFDVHFTSKQKGWAVGVRGTILYTVDGGKRWHISPISRHYEFWLDAVYFVSPYSGWIVGIEGTILHTQNGGKTWQRQKSYTQNFLDDVFFINEREGWAVGKEGVVLHTKDSGKNWRPQRTDTRTDLKAIYMGSPNNGWVVGQYGTILTYTEIE